MRTTARKTLGATLALGLTAGGLAALAGTSSASVASPLVYGLTSNNQLVQFYANDPGTMVGFPVSIGIPAGTDLEGIDVRPATGELYGLLNNPTGADALVVINPGTGAVRTIALVAGAAGSDTSGATPGVASPALVGDEFGFDFNPTIDRIRVTSDAGANYVLNPVSGAVQARQPNVRRASGAVTDVRAVAYTNNVATQTAQTTTTALYDIDIAGSDTLNTQSTAGTTSGQLTLVGPTNTDVATATVTVGTSAQVRGLATGFDIEARTDGAYAVLEQTPGIPQLYRVNLTSGAATPLANLGNALVQDIAIASPRISITGSTGGTEGGTATLTLTRTGDLQDEITVPVSATTTVGTTATAADVGTIPAARFAPGATTATVQVPLVGADGVESSEVLGLILGTPSTANAAVTSANTAQVVITDDGQAVPATSTATISPSPSPTAITCTNPVGFTLDRDTIFPGTAVGVTITGPAGAPIEVQAYSQPNTKYGVVRSGILPSSGTLTYQVTPGTNTRIFAQCVSQTKSASASKVISVRPALSLTVVRNAKRDYTFKGRILPRRAGQLITLYRVNKDGSRVLTSQIKTDATGTYTIRRKFTGSGTFGFLARTGATVINISGESNTDPANVVNGTGKPRPTAIF